MIVRELWDDAKAEPVEAALCCAFMFALAAIFIFSCIGLTIIFGWGFPIGFVLGAYTLRRKVGVSR